MSNIGDDVKACFEGKKLHNYCKAIPYSSRKERTGQYLYCMYQGLAVNVKLKNTDFVFYKCIRGYKK